MLTFAHVLQTEGISPDTVRLLRHQEAPSSGFPSPYILWRDKRELFEEYQGTQSFSDAAKLRAPYWASFVGLPDTSTLFIGLYEAAYIGALAQPFEHPIRGDWQEAGTCDAYSLKPITAFERYAGRLFIDWGPGFRSWIQRADRKAKEIVELRQSFREDNFPGFTEFVRSLSEIDTMPQSWQAALSATRGIYLLTCPKTREQYVGKASGAGGLLARWREYAATGHGGNVALKSRDPSDYQVSILETAGSATTDRELDSLEVLWKRKLQSREMGLNKN